MNFNSIKIILLIGFITLLSTNQTTSQMPINSSSFALQSEKFKILSWNIFMLPVLSRFNGNGKRAAIIGEQLRDSDFQILVFQEAFAGNCRRILRKELSSKYPYEYGPINNSPKMLRTNSGLWILSKMPLKQLGQIEFKEAKSYDAVARKGAVLFEGEFNHKKFQLLATHLQADKPQNIRNRQYKELASLTSRYYSKNIPQILCGDFNTEMSDKKHYSTMLQTLDADNGRLTGNLQVTYDEAYNNLAKTKEGKREIIDYILTRNTSLIANIQRRVLEFYHSDNSFKSHLSDHYAMEATVKFAQ